MRTITKSDFKNIKALQEAGFSPSRTLRSTRHAWPTIQKVYKADTYQEYLNPVAEEATPQPIDDMSRILSNVNEALKLLNDKLDALLEKEQW